MVESAAHLVDHVFPEVPVRQFVLTFPFPLRFLLVANPKALTDVLGVVQRSISTFVIRQAGFTLASGAKTGAVTLIQRFGSALNLNPHLHMLFLDGAYRFGSRKARFHRARRATHDQLGQLLDTLARRIVRVLERRGLLIADAAAPYLELELGSSLNQIQAASITRDGFASPLRTSGPCMASARACATVSPSARMRAARPSPCTARHPWKRS